VNIVGFPAITFFKLTNNDQPKKVSQFPNNPTLQRGDRKKMIKGFSPGKIQPGLKPLSHFSK